MNTAASDHRLQGLLKRYWRQNLTREQRTILNGIVHCGSKVIRQFCTTPAVFVVLKKHSNPDDDGANFFGNAHCHSPWSCPYCSARVMAQKARFISNAINALEDKGQWAAMFTFTMPHYGKTMSCSESFLILKGAWRQFVRSAQYKREVTHTLADGTKTKYRKGRNIIGKFRKELGYEYHVRAYEFTWSNKNNWHPHMHCLFWFPKEKFNEITDYEEELSKRWRTCLVTAAKNYWKANTDWTPEQIDNKIKMIFSWDENNAHEAFFISKNLNGKPRRVKSSNYIFGWSANEEMTRTDLKKAADGHYTPEQILQNAADAKTADEETKWLKLYTDYALATRGHRRVEISHSRHIKSLTKLVEEWLQTHKSADLITQKKSTVLATELVCWFNSDQWWLICNFIEPQLTDIKAQILERARLPNGKSLIEKLLLQHGVDITANGEHRDGDWIAKEICA